MAFRLYIITIFLLSIMKFCASGTETGVQIDQRIDMTFGWEPQDDVLSTMVKVGSSHAHGDSNEDGDNRYSGGIVKRDVAAKKFDGGGEKNGRLDDSEEWRVVEELRGDEIDSGPGVKRDRTGHRIATDKKNKITLFKKYRQMKAGRRHRRDEMGEESSTTGDMEDCVRDGRSVRVKRKGTIQDQREQEIEKEEEGGGEEEGMERRNAQRKARRHDGKKNAKPVAGNSKSGSDVGKKGHGGNHVVIMVELGSQARMACHECSVDGRSRRGAAWSQNPNNETQAELEGKASLLWYRLSREKKKRHFKIEEVSLDMHDDKSRDRVYVTRDHALVFDKTKTRDGGSYFCKSPDGSGDVTLKESVPEKDMSDLFQNPKIHYFYHVDVIKPSEEEAVLVSPPGSDAGSSLPTPSPPTNVSDMNVRIFTHWEDWSPCSVCDQPGTRRRVGQCVVTRLDDNDTARPVFLDAVLSAYEAGVPCGSSLLHGHEMLRQHISKPEEVIQGDCNVTCAVHHAQLVLSASGFLGGGSGGSGEHNVLKQKKFREPEGDHVTLKCQQTSVDKAVAWINGSRVLIPTHLKKSTKGRVWVDEHNSLHINPVLPPDASSYVCLVQGQVKGFVRLEVKAKPPECKVCRYATYLTFTIPVNFVIYIFIVYARHQEQKKTLNYDLLPLGSSSSGSSMDENDGGGKD